MYGKIKLLWGKLPHQAQAAILMGASAGLSMLGQVYGNAGTACWAWACIKHNLWASGVTAVATARAFYMLPSLSTKAPAEKIA